jgi:DNA polymerase III delta prime subunit
VEDIYDILLDIKNGEGYKVRKDSLYEIAEASNGSAREAINWLEMLGSLNEEGIAEKLKKGKSDTETIDLCRLVFSDSPRWSEVAKMLSALKEKNVEPETIRRTLLGYGQAILLKKEDDTIAYVMSKLITNTYDSGFPALTMMLYGATHGIERRF